MSKICQICGATVADEMNFCQNCGAPCRAPAAPQQPTYEQPAPQQPVYQQPAPQQPTYQPAPQQPTYQPAPKQPKQPRDKAPNAFLQGFLTRLKTDRKFLFICAGAVVAVIAIIVIISLVAGGSAYTKPLDNLIAITVDGKASRIEKTAPAAYWEWYEDQYDITVDDLIEDYEDEWDDMIDDLEDEYGDHVHMSYEVLRVKDLKENTRKDIAEILDDRYDIPEKTVTDGKEVTVLLTIEGDDEDDGWEANVATYTMIKIKGAWYCVNYYGGNVSFVTGN